MKLEIKSIEGIGDPTRERVVMRAKADLDMTVYAVFCCKFGKAAAPIAGPIVAVYWFGPKELKKGDLVVLYTKAGDRAEKTTDDGRTSHFYYWGKNETIWDDNRKPVLVHTDDWEYLTEDEATLEPKAPKTA